MKTTSKTTREYNEEGKLIKEIVETVCEPSPNDVYVGDGYPPLTSPTIPDPFITPYERIRYTTTPNTNPDYPTVVSDINTKTNYRYYPNTVKHPTLS